MNFFTRFLLRLFLCFFILFIIVIGDVKEYVNLDQIKNYLSYNINPLEIVNKINGKAELIDLGTEDEVTVSKIVKEYQIIDQNTKRIYGDEFNPVNNHIAGVVTKIIKKDKYTVIIQGIDNKNYCYSNLDSFNYHIYDYIKTDEVLGDVTEYYELMINEN